MKDYENAVYPIIRDVAGRDGQVLGSGITKREYYAGLAMQALVDSLNSNMGLMEIVQFSDAKRLIELWTKRRIFKAVAGDAVKFADALLEELERTATKEE